MNRVILALGILTALVAAGAGVAEYSLAANPKSVLNAPVDTPSITHTPTSTLTPTPLGTPVLCPPEFQDVPSTHPDYAYIHCVACQGSMDNFPCGQPGEPCVAPNNYPYFRPANTYVGTRAEVCKLIVLAARWPINTTGGPHFADVPVCHPYYNYIETAYNHNIIATYACGGRGEPCPGVYFRPGNNATRAQFAKLIVLAEGWPILCPAVPTFLDVPPNDPYYCYIETAYHQGVIDGYSCGPGCMEFRPGRNINSMARAEIARVTARAFTTCSPAPTPTGTPPTQVPTCLPTTSTPIATPTPTLTPTPLGTPVLCPPEFQDVPSTHPDYAYIHCVACQGSMDNFPCGQPGEPCVAPNNYPYFRPGNSYVGTRAEVCKLVVIAARFPIDTTGGPHFNDVPACDPYYPYIETAYNRQIIAGYFCGGPGEPCPGMYFRPNSLMTRAAFAKLLVLAAGWALINPPTASFVDVPRPHAFYAIY